MIHGHDAIAERLVAHGAVRRALSGRDAFLAACAHLDEPSARALAQAHPEYLADSTPVVRAAESTRLDLLRLLLEVGVPANPPGQHEHRALHFAAAGPLGRPAVELLLAHGADPRSRCFGATPADWAVTASHFELARFLAERSRLPHDAARSAHATLLAELLAADPSAAHARDPEDNTPLHCLPEDVDEAGGVIEMLVAAGADLRARDASGKTPAEVAECRGLDDHVDLLES